MSTDPEPKTPISIRLDSDVLRAMKANFPNYQVHINLVLRAYLRGAALLANGAEKVPAKRGRPRKAVDASETKP